MWAVRPRHTTPFAGRDWPAVWLRALALSGLAFLAYPVADLATGSGSAATVAPPATATVLVAALYGWVAWRPRRPPRQLGTVLSVMLVLGVLVPAVWGPTWLGLALYAVIVTGLVLPPATALPITGVVAAVTAVEGIATGASAAVVLSLTLLTVLAGSVTCVLVGLARANRDLRAARAEVARLAAADERQRLAHDLHDDVKQDLLVAALDLATARDALDPPGGVGSAHLERAAAAIGRARTDLAELITDMRTPAADGDLLGRLHAAIGSWADGSGISPDLSVSGSGSYPPLVSTR